MNRLFQQLNGTTQRSLSLPNNIKQMISNFKAIRNPQAVAQKMLSENPQLQQAVNMANGNPEQAFKTMCKQYNVDPNEIMKMLK